MTLIAKISKEKKITQETLAKKLGISQPRISVILSGKAKEIKFKHAKILSEFLGISLDEVFSAINVNSK